MDSILDKRQLVEIKSQIVKCEGIVREALAIQSCFSDINNILSDTTTVENGVQTPIRMSNSIAIREIEDDNVHFNACDTNDARLLLHTSKTPVWKEESLILPDSSPLKLHIQKRKAEDSEDSLPGLKRVDFSLLSEPLQTPPRERKPIYIPCNDRMAVNAYLDIVVCKETEFEKHITWRDNRKEESLIQNTPPPSRPLHRQAEAKKPCMDSPCMRIKQLLRQQQLCMQKALDMELAETNISF